MLSIHYYINTYQSEIDIMMNAITNEFGLPISNKGKSTTTKLDAYWVAFYNNELVGTIGVLKIDNTCSVLKNMFVQKDYRGRDYGIAQALLKTVYDWCNNEGINFLCLGTMRQFKAAHKFYEKNGFMSINSDKLPSDFIRNPVDTVFYVKHLK
jgi:GNAT superfamily N-acetyltransferase